jgi:hypothetical protein
MNIQRFSPSADEAASLLVTTQPGSLAIIAWPRSVACGRRCPPERINWEYCVQHDIPVIYTVVDGAAYFYRDGDILMFVLVTTERITQRQWLDAVCAALVPSVQGLFVDDNDLRLGASRCGMASPELQRPDGAWLNAMEILLHSDLNEARQALAFPAGVWDHKPVSVLEDWIHPLDNELGAEVEQIVTQAVIAATQELLDG